MYLNFQLSTPQRRYTIKKDNDIRTVISTYLNFQSSSPQSQFSVEKFCFLLSLILSHCASETIEIESEIMWGLLPR